MLQAAVVFSFLVWHQSRHIWSIYWQQIYIMVDCN